MPNAIDWRFEWIAVSQDFHVGRGAVAVAFTFHNLCTAAIYVFYIALGILGGPASGPVPYSAIISRLFDRKNLALGMMSFGSGLAAN